MALMVQTLELQYWTSLHRISDSLEFAICTNFTERLQLAVSFHCIGLLTVEYPLSHTAALACWRNQISHKLSHSSNRFCT